MTAVGHKADEGWDTVNGFYLLGILVAKFSACLNTDGGRDNRAQRPCQLLHDDKAHEGDVANSVGY